ncbi:MAG: bifunctional histidinol-phosphatase/imidazoleglycerol-phosphate dehydratase HisB [Prevotellaceae bacterium]|nr:bifunctional histidinol-phosphatase/imidazoleglycerol-phosphate dehydratase HisB [Prevotellaceae bacterium]
MKKILFIDRDGTLVLEPDGDCQLDALEKLEFYPGVFQNLSKIVNELDYELVMVTNQDGLGTESFPEHTFQPVHDKIIRAFENEGIIFADIHIDKSFPHENLPTRKPGTGMLHKYLHGGYDLKNSFVIGDRLTDVELAKNLGAKSILISENPCPDADFTTAQWSKIYSYLKKIPRSAHVFRKTSETSIEINLNIDGSGKSDVSTGLGFFDHMLAQIAKHGNMDLTVEAKGDLHIDEHHTIEDAGIALGTAFSEALGSKKGIERYGFCLPMDDCLAQVAVDFGGRPWLVWQAEFKREKIGEMPTEMFMHFFRSFSDNARCNLNIKAEGENEHHKIEGIFKAFARAIKHAVGQTDNFDIPSTKGSL